MKRILLIKSNRPSEGMTYQPPIGILYLAGGVRERFTAEVTLEAEDHRITQPTTASFAEQVRATHYDVIGFSAMSTEGAVAHEYARVVKEVSPDTITVLGGPHVHSNLATILEAGDFDWVFNGEADRTFADAVGAQFFSQGALADIPGLTWRSGNQAAYVTNPGVDVIPDLNALAMPAWDLVPFDEYRNRNSMNNWIKGKRYAPIFTSRGCPYRCSYCHNIFGKKVRWRSVESCMAEINYLNQQFGVDEFQIIDDIYNLYKSRMHKIADEVVKRYGERKLHFCFPNALRADILDEAGLKSLYRMGTYQIGVSLETLTPRLQKLVDKNLDLEKAARAIELCDEIGISTKGYFMIGFPTETVEEIEKTIRFAVKSKLVLGTFFIVTPQEGTRFYDMAMQEGAAALSDQKKNMRWEYFGEKSWYETTYGIDIHKIQSRAYRRFYFHLPRLFRILKHISIFRIILGMSVLTDRLTFLNFLKKKSAK